MRHRGVLTAIMGVGWLLSCNRGDIIHEYQFDVAHLAALSPLQDVDLWHLPGPTRVIAKDGINTTSKMAQPDGIVDWVEVDVPQRAQFRRVTANIMVFDGVDAAKALLVWEREGRNPSRPDKYQRGVLPNGVEYSASYIVQYRSDPEGCSTPMESYGTFLVFRSGKYLVKVDVSEDRPRGITEGDTRYVAELLVRPRRPVP